MLIHLLKIIVTQVLKLDHRRRIKIKERAKVVASVWGQEFIQFLASLAVFRRTIFKNRMN